MLFKNRQIVIPLSLGIFLGIGLLLGFQTIKKDTFLNPLGSNPQILSARVPSQKPIIGFLPYWNLNSAQIPYHLLDYIAYFSVNLQADGSIKKQEDGNLDIGWLKLKSEELAFILETADKQEVGRMVSFTAFNNEVIDTIISNPKASKQAINSIVSITKEYELDAINLDFEYHTGYSINSSTDKYVQFISQLRENLSLNGLSDINISVDLYADAFTNNSIYDSAKLAQVADWLVLMGYDFYQTRSNRAGPVAPLKSTTGKSITQALDGAIKKGIKTDKIILAMPFYGYEWQTVDEEYNSATFPDSGAMASYKRIRKLIKDKNILYKWDNQAMSPWLVYNDGDKIQQVYYENDQSIGYKLQLITQLQLQGAAIWALGYEGENATVWNVIEEWRKNQK